MTTKYYLRNKLTGLYFDGTGFFCSHPMFAVVFDAHVAAKANLFWDNVESVEVCNS